MRWAAAIALATGAALAAPAAPARGASVDVLVVGKTQVLEEAGSVTLRGRRVRVGSRRCAVAAATPLAALVGTRLPLELRDYGACGRSTLDAGGLFVRRVGPDRNRGRDGWVYKVGRRAGTTGAGDPSGPFGTGRRLRDGEDVLWFWCVMSREEDSCQRTLEVRPSATRVAAGATLRVTVRGYDDRGRGVAVEGASVRLGGVVATTGADGVAGIVAPPTAARLELTAERPGLVPAFPREVTVR